MEQDVTLMERLARETYSQMFTIYLNLDILTDYLSTLPETGIPPILNFLVALKLSRTDILETKDTLLELSGFLHQLYSSSLTKNPKTTRAYPKIAGLEYTSTKERTEWK